VKDALTHLWGGPKLSQSPLLQLSLVQKLSNESGEMNPSNALREILRNIIQSIRPVGERQYTNEWVLFNILDLKFIEGMKVKDIARRLSLSEADLYRKQRVAISAISAQIIQQENRERSSR
jgi:DNA-directed RNA polymerase specialized sigma subunit